MVIKPQPFYRTNLEEKEYKDVFTVRINKEERESLNKMKIILQQPKDSSAIKTLAEIGAFVLQEEKMLHILNTIFKNKQNNKRSGIVEIE